MINSLIIIRRKNQRFHSQIKVSYGSWFLKRRGRKNGNYENTIKGFVSEAFRALTGAPVVFFKHDFIESLWEHMLEADKKCYIMCASASKGELNKKEFDKMGLISDHAYAVISLHVVDTD